MDFEFNWKWKFTGVVDLLGPIPLSEEEELPSRSDGTLLKSDMLSTAF